MFLFSSDLNSYEVILGSHSRDKFKQEANAIVRKIKKITFHPMHNGSDLSHNIAVLRLSTPVNFTGFIQPIQLAKQDKPAGTICIVTGWGETESEQVVHIV